MQTRFHKNRPKLQRKGYVYNFITHQKKTSILLVHVHEWPVASSRKFNNHGRREALLLCICMFACVPMVVHKSNLPDRVKRVCIVSLYVVFMQVYTLSMLI